MKTTVHALEDVWSNLFDDPKWHVMLAELVEEKEGTAASLRMVRG